MRSDQRTLRGQAPAAQRGAGADALFAILGVHQLPPGMDPRCIFRQDLQGLDVVLYLNPGAHFHGFLSWTFLKATGQACLKSVRWAEYHPSRSAQAQLLAEHAADNQCPAPPYFWTSQGQGGNTWVHFRVAVACLMQCGSAAVKDALVQVSGLARLQVLPNFWIKAYSDSVQLHMSISGTQWPPSMYEARFSRKVSHKLSKHPAPFPFCPLTGQLRCPGWAGWARCSRAAEP